MRTVEILAPAGSYESIRGAFAAGADAVYTGGLRFGARAYADNLTEQELLSAIDFAHLHGKKLYLTVNTLLRDQELAELYAYLEPLYRRGLDAVIAADPGVIRSIRGWFPDLPIHASTQMNVTAANHAKRLEALGVLRIIPARELSLREIRRLREGYEGEIECFVHGALCYCYSGQCLLSSMLGGRSGNRGRCAQPCRLPYQFYDGEKRKSRERAPYLLSPKDICLLDAIPDLVDAGVDSFKIEGRMKKPEYAALVSAMYRNYTDLYLKSGREGFCIDPKDREAMMAIYNRGGYSDGYVYRQNGRQMMAFSKPVREEGKFEEIRQQVRKLYFDKNYQGEVRIKIRLLKFQPVLLELTYGTISVKVFGDLVEQAVQRPLTRETVLDKIMKTGNTPFVFRVEELLVDTDAYLPVQELNRLRRQAVEELTDKILKAGQRESDRQNPGTADALAGEDRIREADGQNPGAADALAGEDRIREADGQNPGAVNAAAGGVRSNKLWEVSAAHCDDHMQAGKTDRWIWTALAGSQEILEELLRGDLFSVIYLESWIAFNEDIPAYIRKFHETGRKVYLACPYIFRAQSQDRWRGQKQRLLELDLDGYLVRNMESLCFLQEEGLLSESSRIVTDYMMPTMNRMAQNYYRKAGACRTTAPLELNYNQLLDRGCQESELVIYGYLPLMVTAGCLKKHTDKCERNSVEKSGTKSHRSFLTDRYGIKFPVCNICEDCYNLIYNSKPLVLLDQEEKLLRLQPAAVRCQFTFESPRDVSEILRHPYQNQFQEFTRGHFKRGVQ